VQVTDLLSTNLDWSTFELRQIGFNDVTIDVPPGLQSYTATTQVSTDPNPVRVIVALDPAILSARVVAGAAGQVRLELGVRPGQVLRGPGPFADLRFTAAPGSSAFVGLELTEIEGNRTNGVPVGGSVGEAGRVAVVGGQPLLDGIWSGPGLPAVLVYAEAGTTNVLESTTSLWSPAWTPGPSFVITNIAQAVESPNTNQNTFFRARTVQ
jgi:hypothetical protein